MSRSYRKFLSWEHKEFSPPNWGVFRRKERECIQCELQTHDYGDVIFPRYYGSDDGSWFCSRRHYYPENKIRRWYFLEIRNILNDYHDRRWGEYYDYEKIFVKDFNRIKKGESPDGKESSFEWLNSREAKEAVKNWDGDPIDVLHYFTHTGIIEKAVRQECKRILRK